VRTFEIPAPGPGRDKVQEEFLREIENLGQLDHPCIVKLKGCCLSSGNEGPKIIMEFVGEGSLKEVLRSDIRIPRWWNPTRRVITIVGIVLAMKYLEAKKLIHRDLRPSSILFDDDHRIRICDFGSSRIYESDITMTQIGCSLYKAPEINRGDYDGKVDVYSFGLILYEIVVGNGIFSNPGSKLGFHGLKKEERPSIPGEVLPGAKELIEKCWEFEATKRPNFHEIWSFLERNNFEVISGADIKQVRSFVSDAQVTLPNLML
jgi:serine/threonine protein kinase